MGIISAGISGKPLFFDMRLRSHSILEMPRLRCDLTGTACVPTAGCNTPISRYALASGSLSLFDMHPKSHRSNVSRGNSEMQVYHREHREGTEENLAFPLITARETLAIYGVPQFH